MFARCFNFYLYFIFHFEFYVVVNVLFGITAYGHLITRYGLLHHLFGLLESLVSLTFNLPLFFLSMFRYHSWTFKRPTNNNPRLHHPRSSPLIDYTGMIRSPSINITLSLCMGFCLVISFMGFGMRSGDVGRGVDDKSRISCGFGVLFSLQISNMIFDSSLQNFRPEFIHHSCSKALGRGNFRFAQFLTLNTRFALHLMCLFAQNHRGFDFYQIASIMVFNFLNNNLFALILKDWIMITLFCRCLFHWWIWSSRFFVSDWISIIFIVGWNFLITHLVLYNFCEFVFSKPQCNVP